MDPTQAHSAGPLLTVRLASDDIDPVVQEVAEATLVEHLGSPLRIETGPGHLRVLGPGSSGALRMTVVPGSGGLSSVRLDGTIEGWESMARELRDRFLRAASRRVGSVPLDGYCHALGFGRECDRVLGHSGNHLSVRGEPTAWARDGSARISFEPRFVVEDLLDRIHTLESMVDRARTASRSAAASRRPPGIPPSARPASMTLRPPAVPRSKVAPRSSRGPSAGHRRKSASRSSR